VYFVSKGTVSFCLSKDYGEKEIKEVKKHNNFGEIEMCLSEKLQYNIKVKSRNCELFVLKKNDFLRLSVNFKDFIEKFLYKSLMIYLRFTNEKKRIMKLIEDSNVHLSNKIKKEKGEGEELERIDEEIENEYDIYNANQSDSEVSSNNDVKVENEEPKKQASKKDSSSNSSSSSDSSKTEDEKKQNKKPNMMDSNIINSNYAKMSNGKKDESLDGADIEDSQERTKALNKKFTKKIDKIINFLEKNKSELENFNTTNTLNLLRQLKNTDDLMERNETIDRIEQYLSEILKNK
jgi:CRP-like cAMP-binding protein